MKELKQKYNWNTKSTQVITLAMFVVFVFLLSACEPWDETAEVSRKSYIPEFEIIGEEFQSSIMVDSAEYEDAGALAFSNGEPLEVYSYGEVDLTEVGVYTVVYYAENSDGISATAERIIAVTHNDVTGNDLSGNYVGTIWNTVEMKVTKLHADGYYKCNDIMGYPGAEMLGKFVDLGNHELYLLHGEGDFGRYAASEGEYTLSSLSWTIGLLESPYEGVEVSVAWSRIED